MKNLLLTPLGRTRLIAFLEGVSLLMIIFITMPLKYLAQIPEPNKVIGMIHGLLFVVYVFAIFEVKSLLNWSWKVFFIAFVLAFIPFGTFYLDKKYLNN